MKRLAPLLALCALVVPATAVAHHREAVSVAVPASHVKAHASDWSCSKWAGSDPYHPNAPGSYRSYGCQNPGGDYTIVVGTGYTGTIHSSKLHRVCVNNTILGCAGWLVYGVWHTHS